ncbi:MAG: NAD(P)H-dependent oxidoreductase subunit E [Chloroflexota bacterium]|nr:NAD(P)H-dependent oxidoreductase subunit E [Chloroflexota bacterium]
MRGSDLRTVPMAAALQPAEDDPVAVAEQRARIDAIIAEHSVRPGSTMLILNEIQSQIGYVSKPTQNYIAEKLRVPLKDVFGVVTFYSFFTMKPRGKHRVAFCLGTACYVSGAEMLIEKAQQILGVKLGETTPDRKFTIEPCRCLGACSQAPAVIVDDNVHGRNTPDKIVTVLRKYEKI